MKQNPWVRYYLMFAGSTILTLGIILLSRTLIEHRSTPSLLLGAAFVVYGVLRLRQYKQFPSEK